MSESKALAKFQETTGIAEVFVKSGMFDDVKDVAQATVKIMRGQELGFPPVTSMEVIDIVQKRLFLKPRAIGALINACGYGAFEPLERTSERCVIQFRRKYRDGWKDLPPVEYTIEIAKARGLLEKRTNRKTGEEYDRSPEWQTDPANMLFWRCLGRGGAQYFPELLGGLQVTPDFRAEPVTNETAQRNIADLHGGNELDVDDLDPNTGEIVTENTQNTAQKSPGDTNGSAQGSEHPESGTDDSDASEDEFEKRVRHHCQNYDFDADRVLALGCIKSQVAHFSQLNEGQWGKILNWVTSDGGRVYLQRELTGYGEEIDAFWRQGSAKLDRDLADRA